ncbi:iron ABC transporter [Candidatus Williamhamiltonella defendens]|uniref:Hemin ABC transporter, permease n=1 Tax=Hamiltonella defensa subsp. Acyrthosiphon pisum (strain 5AT) TaxID=572265 RepID=C4K804_HAMD5|nr:iron ABC transporter permease [Candidatus Hamiltonella defensa]ACQ68697.1 hemin ABC transporter, permease [Candidatus Hamiltonella defensa 5AT (Acyrthosiphon pisum)]ATW23230.1 iron ABC transporter [Candidatus Hamiltonella defensa]
MKKTDTARYKLGAFLTLLILISIGSANLGALTLSFYNLWHAPLEDMAWQIWLNIRLPRVLLAILIGSALAVSGTVMQGLFRNPLAEPGLLGISSGDAFLVALATMMPFTLPFLGICSHLIAAFIGSLLISFMILFLSRSGERCNLSRLLLAGIAINTLCGSGIGLLSYLSTDQQLRHFSLWMMGALNQIEWRTLFIATTLILPAIAITLFQANKLNLLQLGDEEAHYLGVDVARTKRKLLLLSALLVGVSVSITGVIGFIGLVVPHLVRIHLSSDHRWLLPGAALGGACLLITADTLARTIVAPAEMPVGLITSLIGAPYFFWLILKQARCS